MSDYNFTAGILRDAIIDELADNNEQLVYVISGTVDCVTMDDVIEIGRLAPDIEPKLVVANLRKLAFAIENGDVK